MLNKLLSSVIKREHQPFREALPRTIAPITAATGVQSGLAAGAFAGAFLGAFAMDNPNAKEGSFLAITGTTAIASATLFGAVGYCAGYAGTNLFMAAFPVIKNTESRFLLKPGFKPQLYLFLGTLMLPVAVTVLKNCINSQR